MAQFLDLYRKCFITSGKNPSHGRLSTVGLRAFNPLSLFLAGEQGAWYDPSDLTTLFQDSAGTTPVTAVEQPVGLMLDKSKGLALGAELVTNGDFSNGTTGWNSGNGSSLSNTSNALIITGTTGYGYGYQSLTLEVGKTYKISWNIVATSSTPTYLQVTTTLGGANMLNKVNDGTGYMSAIFTATSIGAYANFLTASPTSSVLTIDNISVKQIAGNHAFQATAGNRPTLSARVNLLTKTEDFSDGVWASTASNITVLPNYTTAPNGTLTADKIVGTSGTVSPHYVGYGGGNLTGLVIGVVYKASIYIKAAGITTAIINFYTTIANVDLAAMTISGVGSTIDPVGDGWFKCTMLHTATATSEYFVIQSGATYTGDGTNGIYIWGADLRPTNSGALLPAYQRVNTASDYDTAGFPLYLKANGSSSAMSTNSIDFSSTDKMTVVTGVRKLSDSLGSLIELSTVSDTNNGSFLTSVSTVYTAQIRGSSLGFYQPSITAAPSSLVVSLLGDIAGTSLSTEIIPRINGVVSQTSGAGTAGSGNFGNYPLYLFARAGTAYFLNGQFYGSIIRGAQSDTASLTQTENYMATKTGISF